MNLTRVLIARALERSRANDAAAWDDLHAVWNLNRGLWEKPTLIEVLIALAATRMMNAAAGKVPLDEPAWYAEVRSLDSRMAMLKAHQAEAWTIRHAPNEFYSGNAQDPGLIRGLGRVLFGGYLQISAANAAEQLRLYAVDAAALTQCDLDGERFSNQHASAIPRWNVLARNALPRLGGAWQRLLRFQAELEATERYRQIRHGQAPVLTSRCSDGSWKAIAGPDGAMTVRFSRDIPVPLPSPKYPLEYSTAPTAGASASKHDSPAT